jgi:rhomboid protease GluP
MSPLELREAVVRVLAIDGSGRVRPGARLLRHDPEEAALILPFSSELVVFRNAGDPSSLETLRQRIESLREAAKGSRLSLVAVGGGPEVRAVLRAASSFWRLGDPLTLVHMGLEGPLWSNRIIGGGAGVRGTLRQALNRAREDPAPLSPSETEALLVRSTEIQSEEAGFWDALKDATPFGTYALVALMVLLFMLETAWGGSEFLPTLFRMGANVKGRVLGGEVFRLFSAAFLHIGWLHIILNLWALWVFGPFLEKVLGTARFLILYALSALGGSLSSVAFGKYGLSAGASGALWGLMVAGLALSLFPRGLLPQAVAARFRARGWQPLALNFVYSFHPGIDLFAHFGGGLVGGLLIATGALTTGVVKTKDTAVSPPRMDAFSWAAAFLTALMLGSVGQAVVTGRPWELKNPPSSGLRPLPGTNVLVELPQGMSVQGVPGEAGAFVIGALDRDPWSAEIRVSQTPLRDPRDVAQALEAVRGAEEKAAVAEGMPADVRVVTIDGHQAVVGEARGPGDLSRRLSFTIRGGQAIRIDLTLHGGASAAWRASADRLIRSLQVGPAQG